MNGRIYDPKLHRFLQPDNFVQDPTNTQIFNRYAYCINNPLKFIDYSGEDWWSDNWKAIVTVVVAVAVAAVIIASAGTATPLLLVSIYAGAGAGAAAGMVGTALNGGSLGDVFLAGVKGAVFGAISGAAGYGIGLLAPAGALAGGIFGAASSVFINGVMNTIENRPFFQGAGLAAVLGGIGGALAGAAKAKAQGLNPLTGGAKKSVLADNPNVKPVEAQVAVDKATQSQAQATTENDAAANISITKNVDGSGYSVKGAGIVDNGASTFFENAEYSPKVLKATDTFHNFPKSVDGFANKFGTLSTKIGGDGKTYQLLQMHGSYGGKTGIFEYIKSPDGSINHRFFKVP